MGRGERGEEGIVMSVEGRGGEMREVVESPGCFDIVESVRDTCWVR